MKKLLLTLSVSMATAAMATPFTGNDAHSSAMGNTGVASATPQNAFQFNPGLLADYPDQNDFSLTLPSIKLFIDDSEGFAESSSSFVETDGTWERFQTIDSTALENSISAIPTALTDIATDITDITNAINAVEAATNQTQLDAALANLTTASNSLTSNSATLDSEVTTVNTQMANLTDTVDQAQSDLEGFSGKPVQLGLGVDLLSVAMPSETLALGLNISTNTSLGTSFSISTADLDPVSDLSEDLTGFSAEATNLTTAVNALAAANANLTEHFNNAPAFTDPGYAAWETELAVREQAVSDAKDDVDQAQSDLDNYSGANGTVVNGEIIPPSVDDPQSEIEIVGANISEVGVTVARKFVFYGEEVALGVTPKLQSINIFEKTINLANSEDELETLAGDPGGYFGDNTTSLFRANIDIGAAKSWDFYGRAKAGVVIKDLIPWTLESDSGTELLIRPKLRIGAAHETQFSKVSLDLDVTENKPLKYGVPTRYIGIGGELNAWGHAAIRAGYRNNLSVEDSHVITGGIGITPFGTGLDLSAWAKPAFDDPTELIQDVGFALQFSVNF